MGVTFCAHCHKAAWPKRWCAIEEKQQENDQRMPPTTAPVVDNKSKEQLIALADATSGTIGSLVALLVFYPIDVLKTRSQCATTTDDGSNDNVEDRGEPGHNRNKDTAASVLSWLYCDRSNLLFRGFYWKAAHTILSSFTYFYSYSMLASGTTKNSPHSCPNTSTTAPASNQHLKPATELLISMAAAMINVILTLPFDVVSTRAQQKDAEQRVLKKRSCGNAPTCTATDTSRNCVNELNLHLSKQITTRKIISRPLSDSWRSYMTSIPSLWSGIIPSLILCINPAVNYTLYNAMKRNYISLSWRSRWWCRSRQQQKQQQQQQFIKTQREGLARLSFMEAFLFGAIAKFLATILTYPLIRAKVIMMVKARENNNHVGAANSQRRPRHITGTTTSWSPILRLWKVLQHMYRNDHNFFGLYRGLSLQLLHTSLKSALLLMVRETITLYVRQLFSAHQ